VKHRKEYQKSVGYHGKNVSARREIERHGVILRFYETIVWFVANDGVQQLRTMLSSKINVNAVSTNFDYSAV